MVQVLAVGRFACAYSNDIERVDYRIAVLLFVICLMNARMEIFGDETDQKNFNSIVDILLQDESFRNFPNGDQQEFFEVVRVCEESSFVLNPFENMSQYRISSLVARLHNWVEFSIAVQLPIDLRKNQLESILAEHLFRPVFVATDENANEIKIQLKEILDRVESGSGHRNAKAFIEPIVSEYDKEVINDRTPVFKYPLANDTFEHLVKNVVSEVRLVDLDMSNTEHAFFIASSKIRTMIFQTYLDAVPEITRKEMEKIYKNVRAFAESENVSKTVVETAQVQHIEAAEKMQQERFDEFKKKVEMIQLEEDGNILPSGEYFVKPPSARFVAFRLALVFSGIVLIIIVFRTKIRAVISKK